MALQSAEPIFCNSIGNISYGCCQPSNQSSQRCRDIFDEPVPIFNSNTCDNDCLRDCASLDFIYGSVLDDKAFEGNGFRPHARYQVCANLPNMARYMDQDILEPDIRSMVKGHVPQNATNDALKNVTLAVTDCLTATCRNARDFDRCSYTCSAVNLLIDSTTPNVEGLNTCLRTICTGDSSSLPYADADVVGIGVFGSYIMQCMFVVILWFMFAGFKTHDLLWPAASDAEQKDRATETQSSQTEMIQEHRQSSSHHSMFEDFLEDFHKAQCYFSATIQVAAMTYGIFSTNLLITFLLIPLATNGVLPVVFTLFLLYKRDRVLAPGVVLLTIVCWILSSLVYWTLYSNVIPLNGELENPEQEYRAYLQLYYKLAALDACGGYSALAVCPQNFRSGRGYITRASRRIRILTPIIWTFASICLLAIIVARLRGVKLSEETQKMLHIKRRDSELSPSNVEKNVKPATDSKSKGDAPKTVSKASSLRRPKLAKLVTLHNFFYVLVTMCFLAGIGMQLSLLSIATSLDMMDRTDWTFGQVVAVSIWIPPLLSYLYRELDEASARRKAARDRKKENL